MTGPGPAEGGEKLESTTISARLRALNDQEIFAGAKPHTSRNVVIKVEDFANTIGVRADVLSQYLQSESVEVLQDAGAQPVVTCIHLIALRDKLKVAAESSSEALEAHDQGLLDTNRFQVGTLLEVDPDTTPTADNSSSSVLEEPDAPASQSSDSDVKLSDSGDSGLEDIKKAVTSRMTEWSLRSKYGDRNAPENHVILLSDIASDFGVSQYDFARLLESLNIEIGLHQMDGATELKETVRVLDLWKLFDILRPPAGAAPAINVTIADVAVDGGLDRIKMELRTRMTNSLLRGYGGRNVPSSHVIQLKNLSLDCSVPVSDLETILKAAGITPHTLEKAKSSEVVTVVTVPDLWKLYDMLHSPDGFDSVGQSDEDLRLIGPEDLLLRDEGQDVKLSSDLDRTDQDIRSSRASSIPGSPPGSPPGNDPPDDELPDNNEELPDPFDTECRAIVQRLRDSLPSKIVYTGATRKALKKSFHGEVVKHPIVNSVRTAFLSALSRIQKLSNSEDVYPSPLHLRDVQFQVRGLVKYHTSFLIRRERRRLSISEQDVQSSPVLVESLEAMDEEIGKIAEATNEASALSLRNFGRIFKIGKPIESSPGSPESDVESESNPVENAEPEAGAPPPPIPIHSVDARKTAADKPSVRQKAKHHLGIPLLKGTATALVAGTALQLADKLGGWTDALELISDSQVYPTSFILAKYLPLLFLLPELFRQMRKTKFTRWIPGLVDRIGGLLKRIPGAGTLSGLIGKMSGASKREELQQLCDQISGVVSVIDRDKLADFQAAKEHAMKPNNIVKDVAKLVRERAVQQGLTPAKVPNFTLMHKDKVTSLQHYAEYCFVQLTDNCELSRVEANDLPTIYAASWELARALQFAHLRQARTKATVLGLGSSASFALLYGVGGATGMAPIVPIAQCGIHYLRYYLNTHPAPDIDFAHDAQGNEVAFPHGAIPSLARKSLEKTRSLVTKKTVPKSGKYYRERSLSNAGTLTAPDGSAQKYYLDLGEFPDVDVKLPKPDSNDIYGVADKLEPILVRALDGKKAFTPVPEAKLETRLRTAFTEANEKYTAKKRKIEDLEARREAALDIVTPGIPAGITSGHPQYLQYQTELNRAIQTLQRLDGTTPGTGEIALLTKQMEDPETGEKAAYEKAKAALYKFDNPPLVTIVDKTAQEITDECDSCKDNLEEAEKAVEEARQKKRDAPNKVRASQNGSLDTVQQKIDSAKRSKQSADKVLSKAQQEYDAIKAKADVPESPQLLQARRRFNELDSTSMESLTLPQKFDLMDRLEKAREQLEKLEQAHEQLRSDAEAKFAEPLTRALDALQTAAESVSSCDLSVEIAEGELEGLEASIHQQGQAAESAVEVEIRSLLRVVSETQEALEAAQNQLSIADPNIQKAFAIRCNEILKKVQSSQSKAFLGKVKDFIVAHPTASVVVGLGASPLGVAWYFGMSPLAALILMGAGLFGAHKVVTWVKSITGLFGGKGKPADKPAAEPDKKDKK